MESIYTELALYKRKNKCASTDNVCLPISEVCDGTVSLMILSKVTQLSRFQHFTIRIFFKKIFRFKKNLVDSLYFYSPLVNTKID